MINTAHINSAIQSKVAERVSAATDGRIKFQRGAQARFLTTSEIKTIAMEVIKELAPFDLVSFTAYMLAHPDILSATTVDNDFLTEFQRIVHEDMQKRAVTWLFDTHYFACRTNNLHNVLADIKLTADDFVALVPGTSTHYLLRYVDDFIADPDSHNFERVCRVVGECQAEMHRLVFKLDIADPPSACVAAQAWRRMVEIEDQLKHLSGSRVQAEIA